MQEFIIKEEEETGEKMVSYEETCNKNYMEKLAEKIRQGMLSKVAKPEEKEQLQQEKMKEEVKSKSSVMALESH